MATDPDPHVPCSFSIPASVKKDMDTRANNLGLSRSGYINFLILFDLAKGKDAIFDYPLKPGPA